MGSKTLWKSVALSRITKRLIRQRGVAPLMYQYGETVIISTGEVVPETMQQLLTSTMKKPSLDGHAETMRLSCCANPHMAVFSVPVPRKSS